MIQTLITALIVAAALIYAIRKAWNHFAPGNDDALCTPEKCRNCALSGCTDRDEISGIEKKLKNN
jgi:hypothetical protein